MTGVVTFGPDELAKIVPWLTLDRGRLIHRVEARA